MDQNFFSRLKQFIVSHEGHKNHPYVDTVGKITIGIGYNLTDRGLPDAWINEQFFKDAMHFYQKLHLDYPWYAELSDARKMVLIDMCFMGYRHFQTFHRLFWLLNKGDYAGAALEILDSKWAEQVGNRAIENAEVMRTGVWENVQPCSQPT
jgi:lysozyme